MRKMLRECQVSNAEVDKRLKSLDPARRTQDEPGSAGDDVRGDDADSNHFATRPEAPMVDLLSEAIAHGFEAQDAAEYETINTQGPSRRESKNFAAVQPISPSMPSRALSHDEAAMSVRNVRRPGGWKEYFRAAKPSSTVKRVTRPTKTLSARQSLSAIQSADNSDGSRKGLSNDLFKPPPSDDEASHQGLPRVRLHTGKAPQPLSDDAASVTSNGSVASWAVRLVAGTSPSEAAPLDRADIGQQGPRRMDQKSSNGQGDRKREAPTQALNNHSTSQNRPGAFDATTVTAIGPTGTIKKAAARSTPPKAPLSVPSNSPQAHDGSAAARLGPVEMDTILPGGSRPPTLESHENDDPDSGYLTDRFGFIYDQRRKKRQNEAAAAIRKQRQGSKVETLENHRRSLNEFSGDENALSSDDEALYTTSSQQERPAATTDDRDERGRRWTDYLKLANLPTELLSHTPAPAPITSVISATANGEANIGSPNVMPAGKGSNAVSASEAVTPSSAAVSNDTELANGQVAGSSMKQGDTSVEPVRLLLEHLTELHDSTQKEKTAKWNEFLRKVLAENNRSNDSGSLSGRSRLQTTPESSIINGEIIGVSGLGNKGKVGRAKWNEFRTLVLGGIPVSLRAKVWAECSGASSLRIPGYYKEMVEDGCNDEVVAQQVQMDISRTLTDNIFFRKGQGVQKLERVLMAYARRNPDIGYCQGMNLITANLLLIMPTAEDAFWMLASLIEEILPQKYYDHSLLTSRADQVVLRQYVRNLLPQLSNHLDELGVELEALSFQWFLSVFTDCLSAEALFRVWDIVFCFNDGATFLFQVALALLKLNEKQLLDCEGPAEVYAYINQHMTDHAISIDGLIKASEGLKKVVKREDIVQKREQVVEGEVESARQRGATRESKVEGVKASGEQEGSGCRGSNEELEARLPMPAEEDKVGG